MSEARTSARLRVDVWSDVVCPFCWIGKRRLETALEKSGLDSHVDVTYHAFELDPAGTSSGPLLAHLARKFGGEAQARQMSEHVARAGAPDGLRFDWASAIASPTFQAHRVVLLAQREGRGPDVLERLMCAHFKEGADLNDRATLVRLAADAGLDAARVQALLAGDELTHEVRADEAAARAYGIRGVPFFVVDGRYAISGAQPVEVFEETLRVARGHRDSDAPDPARA